MQNKVHYMKKSQVVRLQLTTVVELHQFIQPRLMPPTAVCRTLAVHPAGSAALALFGEQNYLVVPQVAAKFDVQGACFTGNAHRNRPRVTLEYT